MEIKEAVRRIRFNKKMFRRQQRRGVFDATQYYWFDTTPREISHAAIMGKFEDLTAALPVDALVILKEKNGVDGFIVEDNVLKPIELKTSYVSHHTIWKSADGTLYTGKKNEKSKKSTLKSSHEAKYSVSEDNVLTKKMVTFLVLLEDKPGTRFPIYVEIVRVEANKIAELLVERLENQKKKALEDNKNWDSSKARSIGIKYATFELNGTRLDDNSKGYSIWEEELRQKVKKLNKNDEAEYSIQRSNKNTEKYLQTESGKNSINFLDWSNSSNIAELSVDLNYSTKNDPTPQTSSPYTAYSVLPEILNFEDIQPTSLSEIS